MSLALLDGKIICVHGFKVPPVKTLRFMERPAASNHCTIGADHLSCCCIINTLIALSCSTVLPTRWQYAGAAYNRDATKHVVVFQGSVVTHPLNFRLRKLARPAPLLELVLCPRRLLPPDLTKPQSGAPFRQEGSSAV